MDRKYFTGLIVVFLIIIGFRLLFSLQYPYFDYDAYSSLRQVDSIRQSGLPLYQDPLSFGGKINLFAPLFYYVLGFFSLIIPEAIALKLLPNILAAATIFLVYLITKNLTQNKQISLITALFSGIIPVFFGETLNSLSVHALMVPLTLGFILGILRFDENKHLALIFLIMLVITSPFASVLVLTMVIFLLLLRLESSQIKNTELEFTMFITFLIGWFNLLIFKKAFQAQGLSVVWQNIPPALMSKVFAELTFYKAISAVGLFTLVFGIYGLYHLLFETRRRQNYILVAFGLSVLLLLLFRLISLSTGLIYAGILLIILSGYSLDLFYKYLKKTKFSRYARAAFALTLVIFSISLLIPAITYGLDGFENIPKKEQVAALQWLRDNSHEDQVVLASLKEGNIVSYFANRKNVLDTNYLLMNDVGIRYEDVATIYTTKLETEAVARLNKYDIAYLLLSDAAKEEYGITELQYVDDASCFTLIYNESVSIYQVHCRLVEEGK